MDILIVLARLASRRRSASAQTVPEPIVYHVARSEQLLERDAECQRWTRAEVTLSPLVQPHLIGRVPAVDAVDSATIVQLELDVLACSRDVGVLHAGFGALLLLLPPRSGRPLEANRGFRHTIS